MHSAEVVVGEEERHRCFVILPFLAMGIGQASEPTNLHAQCFVAALNVACANAVLVWRANDCGFYGADKFRWGITTRAILRFAVDLDQRGVINAMAKNSRNDRAVRREAVRRQLNRPCVAW